MNEARSPSGADSTEELNQRQLEARASCVVVVEGSQVIGILTERDVVRLCANHPLLDEVPVRQVMIAPVLTLRESALTDLFSVIHTLQQNHIRHVPIVDDQDGLLGLVTHETLQQVLQPTDLLRLLQQEQVVAHLATQIRSSLSLQTILETAVEQIHQAMGCDRVNIWKFEPDFSSVVVAESTHLPHTLLGEQIRDDCFQSRLPKVYCKGSVRVVPDIYTTDMSDCHRAFLIHLQIRAKVILPLFCGEQLWGLLHIAESQTPRDWQADEIDLLRKLATQLTIAIQQASIHEQLQAELQERQHVEMQLRQSTERLQQAQRIAQLGNWELDLQHNILYWSEEFFRIFEIDSQQFGASYEAFLNLVHPEDRAIVDAAYSQHLRDRQPYQLAHRLQMPDGRIMYVKAQCETTFSADGTPLISRGTVQDITQQQEVEIRRERVEASLRQVIEGTAAFTGEEFFPALVRHISAALGVRCVSVGHATSEGFHVLAFCAEDGLCLPPFLPYEWVPCCYQSLQAGSCCHPSGLQALYPGYTLFTDLQAESYLGVCLHNAAGEPNGSLCIFHDAPLADPDWAQTLLSTFAPRAGAELERLLTAQALEQLNGELEERVAQRTAELAEREALLQDFLDNASDLIQIVDIDTGRFKFVNQTWCETLGYTADEMERLTCFDVLTPDWQPHCERMLAQMRSGCLTALEQLELIFVSKSGQQVAVEGNVNCRFETDAHGSQRAVTTRGIFRDVTARKAAEQELQRREARYRGLMEGAADAIFIADLQGHILEANQKAETLLGYPLAELTTLHFTQLHPVEELDKVTMAFATIAQKQRSLFLDILCRRQDGTTVPVDITASVIDINGEIVVQGIFRDISERKAIERALEESRQFLQTVLDTVPLRVFWKDRESRYLGANARFLADAALASEADILGKSDFDMPWAETEAEAYRAGDRTVIDSGEAKLGIIETQHQQDGTEIWLETNKLPLHNLAGEVIGVLGTHQDITDRRKAEITLRRQLAAIEAAINGIAILQDERYVYLNSSHMELFGYQSTHELIGQSWRVLYSPEELERFDQEIWPVLYEQMFWQGEVTATRKDGTTFPEQISLTLSADNLLICVCQDISDRKQEQAVLQQKTTELDRFFSVALDLLCIANSDGYFIRLNHQWEKVLGYPLSDLEGSQSMNFVHPDDVGITLQAMQTLEQGGDVIGFTNRYRCQDGSYRWIEWRSAPSDDLIYASARDITERKQAEIEWQDLTDRLSLSLQAGAYGTWDWDLVNDPILDERACEIYGLQTLGRSPTYQEWRDNIVHPDDIGWVEAQFETALRDRTPFNAELRFWRADGELRWIQIIAKAEVDAEGNPVRVAGINCDITDRKAAEMLIRQNAERETLLREITQLILQRSLNLDEILATVTHQVKEVIEGDRVIIFRLYPDGSSQIVEEAVSDGLPRLRDKHWDDEVWSQDVLDYYWQGQPRIVPDVMGDRWTECLVEYSIEGHIQSKIVAPILQEIRFCESHRWVSPYTSHKLWGVLVIHACIEKRVWLETEAQLLQQIANQVAIAIQQINLFEQLQQELAERQQTQKQLTASNYQLAITNQELARATRLKDEFLANMSHELRTPLNAILGMSEVILEEIFGGLNPKQKQYLEVIQSSGQHLLNLINDILDVAKIASGQITLEYSHVAVEQLCSSSLAFIAQQVLNKRIKLETNIQPHLPDIFADEIRIRQVLLNLLTNAVKFTLEGGTVTLTVSLISPAQDTPQPTYLRIAVTDTGIGIAPENIPKLFKPFVQIDGALNRQQTGTGLGLALVKQIVELHGGQIELTSKLGEGSCFTVDLPYAPPVAPSFPAATLSVSKEADFSTPPANDAASIQSPLILVAEDNATNVTTLSTYFEANGYRLLIANDGQEAIDLALSHHPDVILMDVQMPGVDGLEAMKQIRQQESLHGIPIIALTALAMKGDEERCLAAGADYYLSKPVKLKQLNSLIQELLCDRSPE